MRERAAFENTPDREQVEKLISLVEMMVNGEVPAQKGLLPRFSETMEKHSLAYKLDFFAAFIVVDTTAALISSVRFSKMFPLLDCTHE